MKYQYDVLVIGLGPAGMAVSIMASKMGLKVAAIEKHKIGGECMNVGCIPSKSLLRIAKNWHIARSFGECDDTPLIKQPFHKVQEYIHFINEKKTKGMLASVDLILGEGAAKFVDPHTVEVGNRSISAKKIFIAVGTKPVIPQIPGLRESNPLTNESVFHLDKVPESLLVIGGGPIACEMALAFSRLGTKVSMSLLNERLMEHLTNKDVSDLLEKSFQKHGIEIYRKTTATSVEPYGASWKVTLENNKVLHVDKILVGAGREVRLDELQLHNAGVKIHKRGIEVNCYLNTSQSHIYAVGDCNGHVLLSHAAMHQGMIALMNSMTPFPFKQDFKKYQTPWTVFVDPEISHVGMSEKQLQEKKIPYETISVNYEDYGAAIAEGVGEGFLRAYTTPSGKIYGITIVGEGSGNMINEWALAIQKGLRLHDVMMLQHSFPTMGFLSKRIAEQWMMKRMESSWVQKIARAMFRLF